MSYILEALKKADRDRTLGEVPDLEAAHWGERRPQRSWRWLWIAVVLLLFNAVLLGYLLSRNGADVEQRADTVPAVPPAVTEQQQAPDRTPTVQVPPVEKPVASVQPEVAESPKVILRPRVAVKPHVTPGPAAVAPAPAKAPAARVVQAQQPLVGAADTAGSDVPEWGELPLEFRSRFALPHIDVHVYSEQPRRRFILVDLQKYREGETLSSGAVLEEIQPNNIQLLYQGTRFRVDR
jgi:general secretion pathway protein B